MSLIANQSAAQQQHRVCGAGWSNLLCGHFQLLFIQVGPQHEGPIETHNSMFFFYLFHVSFLYDGREVLENLLKDIFSFSAVLVQYGN